MKQPKTSSPEQFARPSGVWWWVSAIVMTPLFFAIGMSVHGGWPPAGDMRSWALLIGLTAYPLTAETFSLALWHVRERMGQPLWWTSGIQNNLSQATVLACLAAVLWTPEGITGGALTTSLISGFCISILPLFAICYGVDWLIGYIGHIWTRRVRRRAAK